jgi:hypothetical protein
LYQTEEITDGLAPSNSAERGTAEEASSYPAEAFRDGLLRSARSEHHTTEEASSYLTEEITNGLSPSNNAGRSADEEASSHATEKDMDGLVPSVVPNAQEIKISVGLEISVEVVVGGSPTVAKGTGVPNKPTNQRQTIADDIMLYAYPKYSNHPDAAAHIKQFRSIWAVNHGTQGLFAMEREHSMIMEFQLSMEGQAARWYA